MKMQSSLRLRLARFAHRVWTGKGFISTLLLPLSYITTGFLWYKRKRYRLFPGLVYRSPLPVVVVGNLFVGGTGKTPVVIAIVQALRDRGWTPGVISRGYGVPPSTTPRHGVGKLEPHQFGDEPSLIATQTGVPVAVHRRRALALQALEQHYPEVDVVISDDGLQHLALGRDIQIIVQDSRGCGNGRLLPAGPLRESAQRLNKVDFVVTQRNTLADSRATLSSTKPVHIDMTLVPDSMYHLSSHRSLPFATWQARYADTPISAVAGIGTPQRFFNMLRNAGLCVQHSIALADHDAYHKPPFDQLPQAPILLTPKDAIKCTDLRDDRLWVVHPGTVFSTPTWFNVLDERLQNIRWLRDQNESRLN